VRLLSAGHPSSCQQAVNRTDFVLCGLRSLTGFFHQNFSVPQICTVRSGFPGQGLVSLYSSQCTNFITSFWSTSEAADDAGFIDEDEWEDEGAEWSDLTRWDPAAALSQAVPVGWRPVL